MTVRMNCDADYRVVSAIGDGDVVRLAHGRSDVACGRSLRRGSRRPKADQQKCTHYLNSPVIALCDN